MSGQSNRSSGERSTLQNLPPSAKLVFKTLEYEGNLTQAQLTKETLLPSRTVRYALTRLEDEQFITSQISFVDARQRVYSLTDEDLETSANTPLTPTS